MADLSVAMPVVSVVIPTRNPGVSLSSCLHAVSHQPRKAIEVVVIDDGSEPPLVSQIGKSLGYCVVRSSGIGPAAARNLGIEATRGEWVAFVDDDDVVLPNWYSSLAGGIEAEVGLVAGRARFLNPRGEIIGEHTPMKEGDATPLTRVMLLAGTFLVRRSLLESIGGYDERLRYSENTDLGWRLAIECTRHGMRVRQLDDVVIEIHRRPPTARRTTATDRLAAAEIMLDKHATLLRDDRSLRSSFHNIAGACSATRGEWRDARRHFVQSVVVMPMSAKSWARLVAAYMPVLNARVWPRADPAQASGTSTGRSS